MINLKIRVKKNGNDTQSMPETEVHEKYTDPLPIKISLNLIEWEFCE